MCDVAYLLQARAREREVLALQAQSLHMAEPPPTLAEVQAEFDEWLLSEPPAVRELSPQDQARRDLDEAMGVTRRIE